MATFCCLQAARRAAGATVEAREVSGGGFYRSNFPDANIERTAYQYRARGSPPESAGAAQQQRHTVAHLLGGVDAQLENLNPLL